MNPSDATYLRDIALRMEMGTDRYVALIDAAGLRAIADTIDETSRPRSQREIEGDRKRAARRGLWAGLRSLWMRPA